MLKVIHYLSLLHLDYITSTTKPPVIVYVLFQVAPHSIELWHCQFGHLGQEATRNMLMVDYATGITYKLFTQTLSKCIPCLIGKAAQAPFSHHARSVTTSNNVSELSLYSRSVLSKVLLSTVVD
jgi:hypothetical protein